MVIHEKIWVDSGLFVQKFWNYFPRVYKDFLGGAIFCWTNGMYVSILPALHC